MTRYHSKTQQIRTQHGTLYAHCDRDDLGIPVRLWYSTPGKSDNTELDAVIYRLSEAATDLLKEARAELEEGFQILRDARRDYKVK